MASRKAPIQPIDRDAGEQKREYQANGDEIGAHNAS